MKMQPTHTQRGGRSIENDRAALWHKLCAADGIGERHTWPEPDEAPGPSSSARQWGGDFGVQHFLCPEKYICKSTIAKPEISGAGQHNLPCGAKLGRKLMNQLQWDIQPVKCVVELLHLVIDEIHIFVFDKVLQMLK